MDVTGGGTGSPDIIYTAYLRICGKLFMGKTRVLNLKITSFTILKEYFLQICIVTGGTMLFGTTLNGEIFYFGPLSVKVGK